MDLVLEALTPAGLEAFEGLLGGAEFGGCFCAVWTCMGPGWGARCADPARPNLAATAARVRAGHHVGYLVYEGEALVGWAGAGPKDAFPLLAHKLGSRLTPSAPEVWSVGCLALAAPWRGAGLSGRIVSAVIAEARRRGARAVEAYPTRDPDEARVYRGGAGLYARLGFVEAGREPDEDNAILLMRLELDAGASEEAGNQA